MVKQQFDAVRMEDDAAARGWNRVTWAKKARVSPGSVTKFCRGAQTPTMGAKLAKPLGYPLKYYKLRPAASAPPIGRGVAAGF